MAKNHLWKVDFQTSVSMFVSRICENCICILKGCPLSFYGQNCKFVAILEYFFSIFWKFVLSRAIFCQKTSVKSRFSKICVYVCFQDNWELWWYKKNIYRKGKKAENAPSCMEIWELRIPNPGKSVGQHHSEWQWIELVYRDVLSVFCIWKVFFICLWVKWEICSIIRSIFFDFCKLFTDNFGPKITSKVLIFKKSKKYL